MIIFLLVAMLVGPAESQVPPLPAEVANFSILQRRLAEQATLEAQDQTTEVPGDLLAPLLPPEDECDENVAQEGVAEEERWRVEVVFVGQYQEQNLEENEVSEVLWWRGNLDWLTPLQPWTSAGLTSAALSQRYRELGALEKYYSDEEPSSVRGSSLMAEILVQSIARSSGNDAELLAQASQAIGEIYTSDEDRFNFLSVLSSRLYMNYNMARNPTYNNSETNPTGAAVPGGNIGFRDMMTAAAQRNEFDGGVCNDISQTIAMMAERLLPDRDVYLINEGNHFGVLIARGEERRVIDGPMQFTTQNNTTLGLDRVVLSNPRVFKVEDGVTRQIAVIDTGLGELLEQAFGGERQVLRSSAPISSGMTRVSLGRSSGNRTREASLSGGTGTSPSDQTTYHIALLKYRSSGPLFSWYAGVGASRSETSHTVIPMPEVLDSTQGHLGAGARFNVVYQAPSVRIDLHTGADFRATADFRPAALGVPATGHLGVSTGASLQSRNPNSTTQFSAAVTVEHALGPHNMGRITGEANDLGMNASSARAIMRNLSFHFNQANTSVDVSRRVTPGWTAGLSARHQLSNISQRLEVDLRLTQQLPAGAEIIWLTGYQGNVGTGLESDHSNLGSGPSGATVGAEFRRGRAQVRAGVRGIGSERPSVGGGISIGIGGRAPGRSQ